MPAEPWANVENSRRTTRETTRVAASAASPERVAPSALSSSLEFDDSALQPESKRSFELTSPRGARSCGRERLRAAA